MLPITDAWVVPEGLQNLDGKHHHWWRMVLQKPNGAILAIRALSDRVPMMSDQGPGHIARYIYSPQPGIVLEYVDSRTGKALLPELDFQKSFLPQPSPDAVYTEGFASAGGLMGHFLRLTSDDVEPPGTNLSNAKRLEINTDFIIATGSDVKDDGVLAKAPDWNWKFVPVTEADVKAKIHAGFNYFCINDRIRSWVENEAVFIAGTPVYPDDLYRSSFTMTGMFMDEPMVVLGWTGGIPESPSGPEVVAQALRMRIASQDTLRDRLVVPPGISMGAFQLIRHKCPSWETEFWSAWYQLQAGVTGIVHEGRYKHRGYGWEPERLLGPGLEHLTDNDQFSFFYAFLRGAARSFNGDWGTSLYGHSDIDLRLSAFIRAYEMGAKYLWFWTSDHEHHMPFTEQLRIARKITDYAREHPRTDRKSLLTRAKVGIALPAGYAFNWNGTWGMEREQTNRFGVSYGDISAAAFWEGILCSRRGMDYDYLVDHPGIENLGYERLIKIREDGHMDVVPPWPGKRAPSDLRITVAPADEKAINVDLNAIADFDIARASEIRIDGNLSDWSQVKWIDIGEDKWFGDSYGFRSTLQVTQTPVTAQGNRFQGFSFTQLTPEMKTKYGIETQPHESMVVITAIESGSPAESAGLKVGDAVSRLGDKQIKYEFQIWQVAELLGNTKVGRELEIEGRRSGHTLYGGEKDLSANVAFMLDDQYLYFAARVTDDNHVQNMRGASLWKQDSVQIGFRPMLAGNGDAYGENDHELGFALSDKKTLAWRWKGRRGQPVGEMMNVSAATFRDNGITTYEAAIPIAELMPFAPDMWPLCGIDVVVNDCDTGDTRKSRLELAPGAMTQAKHPGHYAIFRAAPTADADRLSAALIWNKRCMLENGSADLTLALCSPHVNKAVIKASLASLDDSDAQPVRCERVIPVGSQPEQRLVQLTSGSPPGRYRLSVTVESATGQVAATDTMNVYIYPELK